MKGLTLVSVLCLLVGLAALTGMLFFTLFLDGQAASNVSAGNDALYVAEAGLHHLWSVIEPAPDFSRERAWPRGEPPFGSPVGFPEPPRTYRVRIEALPDGGVRATSEGTSHRGARRKVEGWFHRDRFRPGAAVMLAPGTGLRDVSGSLRLSAGDGPSGLPAVGGENRAVAGVARDRLPGVKVSTIGASGFADAVDRLRGAPQTTLVGPLGDSSHGTGDAPALVRLVANADVDGSVRVSGIVLADAPLRVRGRLEIDGLLLAPAGIDVEGEIVIRGAAWIAAELRIASSAGLAVEYSGEALDRAQAAGGEALPRPAVLGAWREVW